MASRRSKSPASNHTPSRWHFAFGNYNILSYWCYRSPSHCNSPFQTSLKEELTPSSGTNSPMQDEKRFRVCLVGDARVGKTSIVSQCLSSECMNTYAVSFGENHNILWNAKVTDLDEYVEKSVCVAIDEHEAELNFIDHPAGEISVAFRNSFRSSALLFFTGRKPALYIWAACVYGGVLCHR